MILVLGAGQDLDSDTRKALPGAGEWTTANPFSPLET